MAPSSRSRSRPLLAFTAVVLFLALTVPGAVVAVAAIVDFGGPLAGAVRSRGSGPVDDGTDTLLEGLALHRIGRHGAAIERYRSVVERFDNGNARDAWFLLGEALLLDDREVEATDILIATLDRYPDDSRRRLALYRLGRAQRLIGNYGEAIRIYRDYLQEPTPISGQVSLEIGQLLLKLGQPAQAVPPLKQAADAGLGRMTTIEALERLAEAYDQLADLNGALSVWQRLSALARTDSYRAETVYRQASLQQRLGRADQAVGNYLTLVRNYPLSRFSAGALRELTALGADPGPVTRGIVLYWADRDAEAIQVLNQAAGSAMALQYRGLAQRYLGQSDRALADFEAAAALTGQPGSEEAAIEAARLLEALNRPADAISRYQRFANSAPASPRADEARFRAGYLAYSMNNLPIADAVFSQSGGATGEFPSRSGLWLGKLRSAKGDAPGALSAWQAAITAAPADFYGLRAKALALGESLPAARWQGEPAGVTLSADAAAELDRWITGWSGAVPGTDVSRPGAALLTDNTLLRIDTLLSLGLVREASNEAVDLADRLRGDGLSLYQLLRWSQERGLPRAATVAGESLIAASPEKHLTNAPKALQRLALPLPFPEILLAEARENNVDPLLLAALIRQESNFDRYATSSAQARGLTQVIPSTGEGIAAQIGKSGFKPEDLYRPEVSLEFGAYYLSQQLKSFDGNVFIALAGYNGGPGNARKWSGGNNQIDADIFAEKVEFRETQSYLRLVGRYYYLYRSAYRDE